MVRGEFVGYSVDTLYVPELFKARYGHAPAEVIRTGGAILAGPIGGNSTPSLLARVEAARRPMTAERARQLALELEGVQ